MPPANRDDPTAAPISMAMIGEAAMPDPKPISVGGYRINLRRMGPRGAPAVLMVHGFGGDLYSWMFTQPALAETYDVTAIDLPGHGGAEKEIGALARDGWTGITGLLADILDALEIARAHLVGHSMGGGAALALAMAHPCRVSGLSLIAPAGLGPQANGAFLENFITATSRTEIHRLLEMLVADPSLIGDEIISEVMRYKHLDGVEAALRAFADGLVPNGRPRVFDPAALNSIQTPITAIWGADDYIVPVDNAAALPAGATVHRLPGVGHLPHLEATDQVNAIVKAAVAAS